MNDDKRCQLQISGRDRERILSVVTHIEQSFSDSCSIDTLAGIAGWSCFHFIRQFKAVTGRSPNQYVISLRLRVAAARVAETNARILQIALECGFNDISHFNTKFRATFGCTPRQMRNRSQGRHDCRRPSDLSVTGNLKGWNVFTPTFFVSGFHSESGERRG